MKKQITSRFSFQAETNTYWRSVRVVACLFMFLALLAGCATPRTPLTDEQLRDQRSAFLSDMDKDHNLVAEKIVRRVEYKWGRHKAEGKAGRPTLDVLVLSGGADYGAFGVGFLKGWGSVESGPFARPEFDIVTGVSTGALISPFVFIGEGTYYDEVYNLYTKPQKSWFKTRNLFFSSPRIHLFCLTRVCATILKKR